MSSGNGTSYSFDRLRAASPLDLVSDLPALIAAAEKSPHPPLTPEAQAAWEAQYSNLLDRHPMLVARGKNHAFASIVHLSHLLATASGASQITPDLLHRAILLWRYSSSRTEETSSHGVSFDEDSRKVFWAGKSCSFPRSLGYFRVLRALVMANGRSLSPHIISELNGLMYTMLDVEIRNLVSRIRCSLRKSRMTLLADAIVRDKNNFGYYLFRLPPRESSN